VKVLFLDIDGVLNSRSTTNFKELYPIDPYMAFLVGKIQLDTDCKVVLSSSWRHHPDGVATVDKNIVKLYGSTPITTDPAHLRGDEIKLWLADHPEVIRYAILDDDSDFYPDQPLFKTTFDTGLTDEIAKQVTEYLNEPGKDTHASPE
jgi:hypothetical protein